MSVLFRIAFSAISIDSISSFARFPSLLSATTFVSSSIASTTDLDFRVRFALADFADFADLKIIIEINLFSHYEIN